MNMITSTATDTKPSRLMPLDMERSKLIHMNMETVMTTPTSPGRVRDVVCGMMIEPSKAAGTSDYKGATYYFCSRQCKQAFQNDPAGSARRRQGDDDD